MSPLIDRVPWPWELDREVLFAEPRDRRDEFLEIMQRLLGAQYEGASVPKLDVEMRAKGARTTHALSRTSQRRQH
jgi:hypothetical protein